MCRGIRENHVEYILNRIIVETQHVRGNKKSDVMEVNPVIGSGFDSSRGTFQGDQVSSMSPDIDHGNDHPFHNVDYNTMMVCLSVVYIPTMYSLGNEKSSRSTPESERGQFSSSDR